MARNKPRPIPGMKFPTRHPEPLRTLLRHPKGISALHESSHAVIAALLETPRFESVDLKIRTRETHPDSGIIPGHMSLGFTRIVWPTVITKGCAWRRALGAVAPGVIAQILRYQDDGITSDRTELALIAKSNLGLNPNELLRVAWRLTDELVRDPCVLAAICNTAVTLIDRTELSADEVRAILQNLRAESTKLARPFSAEVQDLIGITALIENHERVVASRVPS
jgi:hypothetical protein